METGIVQTSDIQWVWYGLNDLSCEDLYEIMRLRQEVFVVEQNCAYLDCDGLDKFSLHHAAWERTSQGKRLVAYLRVLPPHDAALPVIGRVLTSPDRRSRGLGRLIMEKSLRHIENLYPGKDVRISAQLYLLDFYSSFGFQQSSEVYSEDGIPHVEMILYHNSHCHLPRNTV
jgi:ElaA protein